ncbi:aspartate/glutamate racemase family protein [Parapedobacter sp. ISTM3]|jgi:aspartate racemase|uniref:aspartate/glutamate racemase family protein n=1 Tax=Parapedobacter sp. ISTM3 TaxID=2800130 RepID=UPI001905BEBD|nr:amino acid racemase [Parapedobacter sp. ISTM3]MBK1441175.1 aspartate/glutamate racemase family protein [Parapedobacter sp. ISTM3]
MIGIVGGVGPLAGIDLAAKIVEETRATTDQEHLPFVLISIPEAVPDRTEYLLGREPVNPAIALSSLLLRIEKMGVKVAAIACNTAHAAPIFDEIGHRLQAASSQLELNHLIRSTVAFLGNNHNGRQVGILSSLGTWKFGLYSQELENGGFEPLNLPKPWAERVHRAIYHPDYGIKAHGKPISERARSELYAALDVLVDNGATCVILGCTEIPLCIAEATYRGVPLLDPVRILARTLIAALDRSKLIPRAI